MQQLAAVVVLPPDDGGEGARAGDAHLLHLRLGGDDPRLVEDVDQRVDVLGELFRVLEDVALAELPDRRRPGEERRHRFRVGVVEARGVGGEERADVGFGGAHASLLATDRC